MKELNRELFIVRDELKETNYNNQLIEKRLLKTQEDYEMIRSKFETFKDIEIVNCAMMFGRQFKSKFNSCYFRLCENRQKTKEMRTKKKSRSWGRAAWIYWKRTSNKLFLSTICGDRMFAWRKLKPWKSRRKNFLKFLTGALLKNDLPVYRRHWHFSCDFFHSQQFQLQSSLRFHIMAAINFIEEWH